MITTRIRKVRPVTFDEWLKKNGYVNPLSEFEETSLIGGTIFGNGGHQTRASRGKLRNLEKKQEERDALYRRYEEAVGLVDVEVPLDDNNALDQAYKRVMERRTLR